MSQKQESLKSIKSNTDDQNQMQVQSRQKSNALAISQ
jgi:hypothetical protein